jgi:hypothetical protein
MKRIFMAMLVICMQFAGTNLSANDIKSNDESVEGGVQLTYENLENTNATSNLAGIGFFLINNYRGTFFEANLTFPVKNSSMDIKQSYDLSYGLFMLKSVNFINMNFYAGGGVSALNIKEDGMKKFMGIHGYIGIEVNYKDIYLRFSTMPTILTEKYSYNKSRLSLGYYW